MGRLLLKIEASELPSFSTTNFPFRRGGWRYLCSHLAAHMFTWIEKPYGKPFALRRKINKDKKMEIFLDFSENSLGNFHWKTHSKTLWKFSNFHWKTHRKREFSSYFGLSIYQRSKKELAQEITQFLQDFFQFKITNFQNFQLW